MAQFFVYANASSEGSELENDGQSVKEKHGPFSNREDAEDVAKHLALTLPRTFEDIRDGQTVNKYNIEWKVYVVDPEEAKQRNSARANLPQQRRTSGSPVSATTN